MRTFSEINHDIRKCKQNIENASSKKEYFQCLALLDKLECEKDRVWDTLFHKHRNIRIGWAKSR